MGRLYAIEKGSEAGLYETALAGRADCMDPKAAVIAGLMHSRDGRSFPSATPPLHQGRRKFPPSHLLPPD